MVPGLGGHFKTTLNMYQKLTATNISSHCNIMQVLTPLDDVLQMAKERHLCAKEINPTCFNKYDGSVAKVHEKNKIWPAVTS